MSPTHQRDEQGERAIIDRLKQHVEVLARRALKSKWHQWKYRRARDQLRAAIAKAEGC